MVTPYIRLTCSTYYRAGLVNFDRVDNLIVALRSINRSLITGQLLHHISIERECKGMRVQDNKKK